MSTDAEIEVTQDQVLQLLRDQYGITGCLTRLPGENLNYLVELAGGGRYVLKIASVESDNDVIDMEHSATEHVARSKISLHVPRTVTTKSGSVVSSLSGPGDGAIRARMLEFVTGTPWCELGEYDNSLLCDVGRKLAELGLVLESFTHPAMYRTHRWDLTQVAQHGSNIPLVGDNQRRRMLEWMLHFNAAAMVAHGDDLPRAFIHNDVNDENMLVDGDRVVGLLDFGDCLYNPIICDLAITLAYVMMDRDRPLETGSKVVAGYQRVRKLSRGELHLLFPLVCARLVNTVIVAAKRRTMDPDHPNWFVSEDKAWRLLRSFNQVDPNEACAALTSESRLDIPANGGAPPTDLVELRRRFIGPSLSISYPQPIKMVRGGAQFLFDHRGRPYLDLVNNICHVGHCHPHVVAAGQSQMAVLNTNTRYLYDGLTDYAQRLCATLPEPLTTCFFVNSGSEANELALRLARTHTGREDFLVVEGAYHGNTSRLVNISPYKFMGAGGTGKAVSWVHLVPMADGYRGIHKGQSSHAGAAYGDEVRGVIKSMHVPPAGFVTETIWSCGGQVVPPPSYLKTAFAHVREAGGVCIVDEVQVGFARVGRRFWGFQLQDVVPDIVVMGKPMGNGHPVAAVVTTAEIAGSFNNGMEFFSSFGGNPVSCAIGMAVLDVIENEGLQQHALDLGEHFKQGLRGLAERHPLIGEVRGEGLFLGVELVTHRGTLAPAPDQAKGIVNAMKERGVLMSTDGPLNNVLKIKPPMVITQGDVDMVLRCLDDVLGEYGL